MMPTVLDFDGPSVSARVQEVLETGGIVIFPTDTIYGIGGNPWDDLALAKVREAKRREPDQPFTLHVPTVANLRRYATYSAQTALLIDQLLPGPYTVLLEAASGAPASAVQGRLIGIRVPDHPFFFHVMSALARPLFGTSVNVHGEQPLSDPYEIIDRFSWVDLILTGPTGRSPSSIIDLSVEPPRVLRGALPPSLMTECHLPSSSTEKQQRNAPHSEQSPDRLP